MKLKFPAQGSISENKKKSVMMIIFLHLHESFFVMTIACAEMRRDKVLSLP
jgi:hypothetical protein